MAGLGYGYCSNTASILWHFLALLSNILFVGQILLNKFV